MPTGGLAGRAEFTEGGNVNGGNQAYVFPGITIRATGETSSAVNRQGGSTAGGAHASGAAAGNGAEDLVHPEGNTTGGHEVDGTNIHAVRPTVRGSGAVSDRMGSNLRLQIGMVRTIVKGEIGDKFPRKFGLKHDEPTATDVLAFYDRMLTCTSRELAKKWFKHLVPYLVVLCGEDFVREFGPNGRLTVIGWICLGRMIVYMEDQMYGSQQIRWRHIFDVRLVLALMYNSYSLDYDYMNTMMSFDALGYRLEWTKKIRGLFTLLMLKKGQYL